MKQPRVRFYAALIVFALSAVLCAVVPASADLPEPPDVDFYSGACGEFADTLEPSLMYIPVTCETSLCCPGCSDQPIDWRIRVSGASLESVLLRFDNLPPKVARKLSIKGKARWEGTDLRVGQGETIVRGFKYDSRAVPPVATPRLFANKKVVGQLLEAARREETASAQLAGTPTRPFVDRDLGRMEVIVEQLMGEYVVNEARIVYNLSKCSGLPGNTDHVLLSNNIGDDMAAVFLDARDGNGFCLNDTRFMGTGENILVGDLRPSGSCNDEIWVFSKDNAMAALLGPIFWSDSMHDEQPVSLQPLREAPVAVWIVEAESGTQERAEWEMASANYYYNTNRVGIAFNATFRDVSGNAAAREAIGTDCSNVSSIKDSDFYRPNQLNVYYVFSEPSDTRNGTNCYSDPNILFIYKWPTLETLAHELGHAFSLEHPNGCESPPDMNGMPGIISHQNIMWEGTSNRTRFSLGQAYRMNLNVTSMLNVNGVRTGPVQSPPCAEVSANDTCPRLDLDAP